MKWTREAEEAVSKVPFFVRRRVKKRVEEEAERRSAYEVTLDHVRTCQRRFLKNMESEVKGHQVETCFGSGGCPNRAVADSTLCTELEELVSLKRLREFLKTKVQGPLKMHHEFRISVSDCPNACSRPQIADLGLIAAVLPRVSSETCSQCGACVEVCKEEAVRMLDDGGGPALDLTRCVACGQCIRACPRETMEEAQSGYRILVGGKLGRHPQLAIQLQGIHSREDALRIVDDCLEHFKKHNTKGERFGEILNRTGLGFLDHDAELDEDSQEKKTTLDPGQGISWSAD